MRFWMVACSSVEEVADVIARALKSRGYTVKVRWEQSFHFPQEYVRVDGVEVIDAPYGKFKIMTYFTVKKTLKKPDRCEVKAGYLVKVLEDRLNNPNSFELTHQPPYIPELYPNMRDSESAMLMTQALERIRPRLHFNGHMAGGCYSYYEFKWRKYLRVDSSARFRCYALTDGRDVAVYQKGKEVFRFSL